MALFFGKFLFEVVHIVVYLTVRLRNHGFRYNINMSYYYLQFNCINQISSNIYQNRHNSLPFYKFKKVVQNMP